MYNAKHFYLNNKEYNLYIRTNQNIIMAIVLKQPTLNEYTLNAHELNENLNHVIKHKNIKPSIKKIIELYEQSTRASITEDSTYKIPEFNNELIDYLTNDEHIIYNKHYKQETYLNQPLFYINYTYRNKTIAIYAHGHKPDNYKFIDNLGNLYLCSNKPFYFTGCEPLNTNIF